MNVSDVLLESKSNGKFFEKVMENIKHEFKETFAEELDDIEKYLIGLGFDRDMIRVILDNFDHHNFQKIFLMHNSFGFLKGGKKDFDKNVFVLSEIISIPIIFMDDVLDSHSYRDGKLTLYGFSEKSFPDYKKENTLFMVNILFNYFLNKIAKLGVDNETKTEMTDIFVSCFNKTIAAGLFEQERTPKSLKDVLNIYKEKSYHFSFHFPSIWGAVLASGNKQEFRKLEEMLMYLNYLILLKNDIYDIYNTHRTGEPGEDLLRKSNPFLAYLAYKNFGVEKIDESNIENVVEKLKGREIREKIALILFSLRNKYVKKIGEIKSDVQKDSEKFLMNYLFYLDYVFSMILDKIHKKGQHA